MRPDVTIVRPNGVIDMYEVRLGKQTRDELMEKLREMQNKLPEKLRGEIDVTEIK